MSALNMGVAGCARPPLLGGLRARPRSLFSPSAESVRILLPPRSGPQKRLLLNHLGGRRVDAQPPGQVGHGVGWGAADSILSQSSDSGRNSLAPTQICPPALCTWL